MPDKNLYAAEGIVVENLPNTTFRVKIESSSQQDLIDRLVLCTIAGRMRLNYVRLLPGDRVRCEISTLDTTRGRIIYKLK
jgi:translation initiation factor IF-1